MTVGASALLPEHSACFRLGARSCLDPANRCQSEHATARNDNRRGQNHGAQTAPIAHCFFRFGHHSSSVREDDETIGDWRPFGRTSMLQAGSFRAQGRSCRSVRLAASGQRKNAGRKTGPAGLRGRSELLMVLEGMIQPNDLIGPPLERNRIAISNLWGGRGGLIEVKDRAAWVPSIRDRGQKVL